MILCLFQEMMMFNVGLVVSFVDYRECNVEAFETSNNEKPKR
jgi:hypothetical protein